MTSPIGCWGRLSRGASAMLSSKLVKGSVLKVYPGFPHGMCTTKKDQINTDLLAFIKT
jgi:non-heme chloroperoxidase